MCKFYMLFIILSILLISIKSGKQANCSNQYSISKLIFIFIFEKVNSIECYKCDHNDANNNNRECEKGLNYNIDRGPCRGADEKYCFKIAGLGGK